MKFEKKWLIPYLIAVICLCIGTFFDYQIDAFLYHPDWLFGIVLERYVLWLFIATITFVFAILQRTHRNYFYVIPEIFSALYAVIEIGKYIMPIDEHWVLVILLAIGVLSFCNMIVYAIPIVKLERMEKKGIFFVCVILTSILITFILKNLWGRIRFRDLESISEFTMWFLPQGLCGHFSFPSGHVTAASSILSLLVISKYNREQKTTIPVVIIVYSFILCMVVSRMIMGAHYLSDVSVAFMITYTVFLCYRHYFYRKRYL